MPDISTSEGLLAEILDQASSLNPESLSKQDSEQLQKSTEPEWLPTHDYTELDDQPNDPELDEMAKDTLEFFIETSPQLNPGTPEFEFEFRAFLHNEDYSYPAKTIANTLNFLK